MRTRHAPQKNRILCMLEPTEFNHLSPNLELVRLEHGEVLYQAEGKMEYAYFPITATISIDYVLENGSSSEIASIGNEGMLGVSILMGSANAPARAVVQLAGAAYRLSAPHLMDEFYHKGALLRLLLRYAQARLTQISQLAVCNSHHSTQQRLCRFLLQMLDRTSTTELPFTQEEIGAILGVRREGVTEAVRKLQQIGVIKWRRGHVAILSRSILATYACECYEVIRKTNERLLPERAASSSGTEYQWRERSIGETRRLAAERRKETYSAHLPIDTAQAVLEFF